MTAADSPFLEELLDYRRRKDAHFAGGHGPIRGAALETFGGLRYYPPDPTLRFMLPLTPSAGETVMLETTSGEPREMTAFGTVGVPFAGGTETLTLYAQPGEISPQRLFLPFRDAGSGSESYGAGRYLDVPLLAGGLAELDFNRAYQPYCAYGEGWACALPPAGNWVRGVVRAGERLGAG